MKRYSLCPICGDEKLHETSKIILREIDGFKKEVPFHFSVCESCDSETLTDKQATFNKRQMADFYRESDGLLTGKQIKAIREDLNLTQVKAAEVFGGGKNAFTKYESGDVTQSVAMDKLLRTAFSVPAAFDFLCQGCPSVATVELNQPTLLSFEKTLTYTTSIIHANTSKESVSERIDKFKVLNTISEPHSNSSKWKVAEHSLV